MGKYLLNDVFSRTAIHGQLNILPIPALDGGHLMFLLVEKIMGRPLDEKIIETISTVFFSLLIILMIVVVFNDIVMIAGK